MIRLWIVAEEGEFEAAFTGEGAVAAAAVAAGFGNDGEDIVAEGDFFSGERGQPEEKDEEDSHANNSLMGSVPRSVKVNGLPPGPGRCEA